MKLFRGFGGDQEKETGIPGFKLEEVFGRILVDIVMDQERGLEREWSGILEGLSRFEEDILASRLTAWTSNIAIKSVVKSEGNAMIPLSTWCRSLDLLAEEKDKGGFREFYLLVSAFEALNDFSSVSEANGKYLLIGTSLSSLLLRISIISFCI